MGVELKIECPEINPSDGILMGPGPSAVSARVLAPLESSLGDMGVSVSKGEAIATASEFYR
mgnify:CR=1 FL=1